MMRAAGQALGQTAHLGELRQVIFICEGWMSLARDEPKIQIRPSVGPARKEVLFIDRLSDRVRRTVWLYLR